MHDTLERWFRATVQALDPARATHAALAAAAAPCRPPALIAIGKAALGMAEGAVDWVRDHGMRPSGGLIVAADPGPAPDPNLRVLVGDHPLPGKASAAAADALAAAIGGLPVDTPTEVLLSGGTSSLVAAPVAGLTGGEMRLAFTLLHAAGLPIHTMNAIRRRLTRWGGGRLAVALAPRPVRAWVISDVLDNDLAAIGSGPLVAEAIDPGVIATVLREHGLVEGLPAGVVEALALGLPSAAPPVPHILVADRHTAARAAAAAVTADGGVARVHRSPLSGEAGAEAASLMGRCWITSRRRAPALARRRGIPAGQSPCQQTVHIWTGETTVTLPDRPGRGGRAQQFALAAARELHRLGRTREGGAANVSLLVAGTDGRDGPTDAAGAIVDDATWSRMLDAGLDPDAALGRADAYPVLDAVGALLRTGSTGTNLADIVMVVCEECADSGPEVAPDQDGEIHQRGAVGHHDDF